MKCLVLFQAVGILEDMGGDGAVSKWDAQRATHWQTESRKRAQAQDDTDMKLTLASRKNTFLERVVPSHECP